MNFNKSWFPYKPVASNLALYLKMFVLVTAFNLPNFVLVSKSRAQFAWNFELRRRTTSFTQTLPTKSQYELEWSSLQLKQLLTKSALHGAWQIRGEMLCINQSINQSINWSIDRSIYQQLYFTSNVLIVYSLAGWPWSVASVQAYYISAQFFSTLLEGLDGVEGMWVISQISDDFSAVS